MARRSLRNLLVLGTASLLAVVGIGCKSKDVVPAGPQFSHYATPGFDWNAIQRVVVMPVANRSEHPQAPEQVQKAIAAELQRRGRFEVVIAANDSDDPPTDDVFRSGQFDEEKLLAIYHRYHAQGVLFVKITEYHPYSSPRIGLSTLLVSPEEAVVVAAMDGQWDLREASTLARARNYHEEQLSFAESLFETDRVLASPHTFQRFVASEIAQTLESSTQPLWHGGNGPSPMIQQAGHYSTRQPSPDPSTMQSFGAMSTTMNPAAGQTNGQQSWNSFDTPLRGAFGSSDSRNSPPVPAVEAAPLPAAVDAQMHQLPTNVIPEQPSAQHSARSGQRTVSGRESIWNPRTGRF